MHLTRNPNRVNINTIYKSHLTAFNLISDREVDLLKHIETFYDTKINEMPTDISEYL